MLSAHTALEKHLAPFVDPEMKQDLGAFVAWLETNKSASPLTVRTYVADLKTFLMFLAIYHGALITRRSLATCDKTTLRAYLASRRTDGVSTRLNARSLSALRTFFDFMVTHKGKAFDASLQAAKGLRMPKRPRLLPKALPKENTLLLTALDDTSWVQARDKALFVLLYGTGMRIGEALSLQQKAIPAVYHIDATLRFVGKGNKERTAPLLPDVFHTLDTYRAKIPHALTPAHPLFLGARGGPFLASSAATAMAKLRGTLGLTTRATPHTLRHSFATHLLNEGVSLRHIQALLGHTSLRSTQIYTDVTLRHLTTAYDKAHPQSQSKTD